MRCGYYKSIHFNNSIGHTYILCEFSLSVFKFTIGMFLKEKKEKVSGDE